MKFIVVTLAALTLGLTASPASAQQQLPSADRTMHSVAPAPPPARYVPPPFPPMPKLRPGQHLTRAATHHSTVKVHARDKVKPKSRASGKILKSHTKHEAKSRHKHEAKRPAHSAKATKKVSLSKRTIRQCHGMNYQQIMSHHYCRALLKDEIAAADRKHQAAKSRHHSAKKAKTSRRSHKHHR